MNIDFLLGKTLKPSVVGTTAIVVLDAPKEIYKMTCSQGVVYYGKYLKGTAYIKVGPQTKAQLLPSVKSFGP